jgi:alginate O-acetyltransferase complex protein AlgI
MFLVSIGLFKKVVVSDYLRINLVDRVVAEPTSYSSLEVLVGMFGYAIQIYCDFSGTATSRSAWRSCWATA